MKVNQTWDPIYKEKNSTEYKDLTENFRNQVNLMKDKIDLDAQLENYQFCKCQNFHVGVTFATSAVMKYSLR